MFGQSHEFTTFIENNPDVAYLSVAGLLSTFGNAIFLVIFISMSSFLFRIAVSFERGHLIRTPDEDLVHKEIKQIKDQVNQIYLVKVKGSEDKEAEVKFKNTKIVAWLLNRKENSQKKDREAFFKRVNDYMRMLNEQEK